MSLIKQIIYNSGLKTLIIDRLTANTSWFGRIRPFLGNFLVVINAHVLFVSRSQSVINLKIIYKFAKILLSMYGSLFSYISS